MQRSGLGSELDIDCLVATLCLGTMISWLHYVRCVVWLQMKIITGLAKLSGNKSCPPRLLTNSAGCRHCEASLKPISLTFRMFLFFSDFYDRRHNWFHNTIDKSQVTKPRLLQHSRLGPCLRVHIMLMKWYPGKAGDLVQNGWAIKLNHLHLIRSNPSSIIFHMFRMLFPCLHSSEMSAVLLINVEMIVNDISHPREMEIDYPDRNRRGYIIPRSSGLGPGAAQFIDTTRYHISILPGLSDSI